MFSQLYPALPRACERQAACAVEHEATSGQQPLLQELAVTSSLLGSFSLFSPLFLPNMCYQTPTFLCQQPLFFASFLAALHLCFHQWSSTWKHIDVSLPKAHWLRRCVLYVSAKQSNSSPQTILLPPHTCLLMWALSLPRWLSAEPAGVLPWLVFREGCWFSGGYSESRAEGGNAALLKFSCWYQWGRIFLTGHWVCFWPRWDW